MCAHGRPKLVGSGHGCTLFGLAVIIQVERYSKWINLIIGPSAFAYLLHNKWPAHWKVHGNRFSVTIPIT